MKATELRNMWENRPFPVVYSSPYREIPLNCSGKGTLTRILVGTHTLLPGDQGPQVEVKDITTECNINQGLSVLYECILDSPVQVGNGDSLRVLQRHSDTRIAFIHDGVTDISLISVDISK